MTLAERLVELHRSLSRKRIPHAFGGAISLAYWTLEPRGTTDIDVNVFVPVEKSDRVLKALPAGVEQPEGTVDAIARDGQIRLWWEGTAVDLFFDYAPIHGAAKEHRRTVTFADARIPVLGPVELATFKAMFDRSRDWVDIEAMLDAGTLDVDALRRALAELVSGDDARFARLDELVRRVR